MVDSNSNNPKMDIIDQVLDVRLRNANLAYIENKASQCFADIGAFSDVYLKRVTSGKTKAAAKHIFGQLPFVDNASLPFDSSETTTATEKRKVKRKRPADGSSVVNFTLKHILQKALQNGYLQLTDVLFQVNEQIKQAQLVEDNCDQSFKDSHDVTIFLEKLNKESFVKSSLGLCCTKSRTIKPRAISCKSYGCTYLIDYNVPCWEWTSSDLSEKIIICTGCHNGKKSGEMIKVKMKKFASEDSGTEWLVIEKRKTDFRRTVLFPGEKEEPTVKCIFCLSVHHNVCVMYDKVNWETAFEKYCNGFNRNFRSVYVCRRCVCILKNDQGPPDSGFNSIQFYPVDLEATKVSISMEKRLTDFFRSSNINCKMCIREVSVIKSIFEAKPNMKKEFLKNKLPFQWEYIQRSIMLFQQKPGCTYPSAIFNLIVYEYPSTGSICLSYIDSVKLFEPENLRRQTFQEIILSYLFDASRRGYKKLYFWACPPNPGDEYVFYGRPEEKHTQVTHGEESGIIRWYQQMLERGIINKIVESFKQVGANYNPYGSYLNIPYLLDDFWPQKLEGILESHTKEMQEYELIQSDRLRKRQRVSVKKQIGGVPYSVQQRVEEVIRMECRGALFVATLVAVSKISEKDDEPDILCPYMSSRDNFIVDCRENQYDFSTDRRANFSTMKMIARIAHESLSRKCIECEKPIKKGLYCYSCPEALFCSVCVESHPHKTIRQFKVPLVYSKIQPDIGFSKILQQLKAEGDYLTSLSHEVGCPRRKSRINENLRYESHVMMQHRGWLHKDHHRKEQTNCRACSAAMLTLGRHKEFCRGEVCRVPSCSSKLLFNNHGVLLRQNGTKNMHGTYPCS